MAQAVSNLIKQNLLEVNRAHYSMEEIEPLLQAYSAEAVRQMADRHWSIVALEQNKDNAEESGFARRLAGTATLVIPSLPSPDSDCRAIGVFVRPDLHGRGIGRRLTEAVEAEARRRDAPLLAVQTSITARRFYERLGYEHRCQTQEPILSENRTYPMQKRLR